MRLICQQGPAISLGAASAHIPTPEVCFAGSFHKKPQVRLSKAYDLLSQGEKHNSHFGDKFLGSWAC